MVEKFIAIKYYAKYSTHAHDVKRQKNYFCIFLPPWFRMPMEGQRNVHDVDPSESFPSPLAISPVTVYS